MALISCDECGKQVSDKAPTCPSCGAPVVSASTASPVGSKSVGSAFPEKSVTEAGKVFVLFGVAVLLGTAGFFFWLWRSNTNEKAAPPSAGLAGLIRQPEKIVNESRQLKEGQSVMYAFNLTTDARVQVQVNANPKPVDVMLMNSDDAAKFELAQGKLFGGQYSYRQALSGQHILTMDKTEALPQGAWTIVVLRPREDILFTKGTNVATVVTVY